MIWCHSSIQDEGIRLTGVVIDKLHGVTVAPGLPDQGAVCRVEIGVGRVSDSLGGSQTIFVIGVADGAADSLPHCRFQFPSVPGEVPAA